MEEFIDKYCYIIIDARGKYFYYTCALVTSISDTHISFKDVTKDDDIYSYRKSDVVEIKLSNKGHGDNQ